MTYFSICFHTAPTLPSDVSIMMTSPFSAASSIEKSVLPGTQPSASARPQLEFLPLPLRWPTITLMPLSRMLSACAGPWMP